MRELTKYRHHEPRRGLSRAVGHLYDALRSPRGVKKIACIIDKVKDATYIVATIRWCENCKAIHAATATGFSVHPRGWLVTSYHVLDRSTGDAVVVMSSNGDIFPVKAVLAADPKSDVVLFELDVKQPRAMTSFPFLKIGRNPRIGEEILTVSHPQGLFYTASR
eukprot:GHVU01013188.1.p3 GENE.GHVU01013188.1~~GHVU01013188.1.p3  ORF type:complete len:164 (-),score=12.40 GHVU01013188.1:3026-3517(-)